MVFPPFLLCTSECTYAGSPLLCGRFHARERQHHGRQPCTVNWNTDNRGVQLLDLRGREADSVRAEIIQKVRHLSRAGNRNDPGFLRQKPAQRNLSWRSALAARPGLDDLNKREVP